MKKIFLVILSVLVALSGCGDASKNKSNENEKSKRAESLQIGMYEDLESSKRDGAQPSQGEDVTLPKDKILLDGDDVETAEAAMRTNDATGVKEYVVNIKFASESSDRLAHITRENIGKQMAIIVKGHLVSFPTIASGIEDGKCVISGGFENFNDADDLAKILNQ